MSLLPNKFICFLLLCVFCSLNESYGQEEQFCFVQLTDLHILTDSSQAASNFMKALDEIQAMPCKPEFIIVSGDIAANNGEKQAYKVVGNIAGLYDKPIYYAVGNHDLKENFIGLPGVESKYRSGQAWYYQFIHNGYRIVVLDSTISNKAEGYIDGSQLVWLKSVLVSDPEIPAFVFLHHHLLQLSEEEEFILKNGEDLIKILANVGNVVGVFSGHAHRASMKTHKGILLVTTSSLSYPFDDGYTGYRVIKVDGERVKTAEKVLGQDMLPWVSLR